jgi:hypothetical protein
MSGGAGAPPGTTLPCFVDEGTPAGDAIHLELVPNRTSGVAPLAVFFDTVGTTGDAAARPFHDLGYCWDFGDPDAGSFATTGFSKNQSRGPVAGHVFEKPGSYAVTVNARDAEGRVASREVTIDVDDPEDTFSGSDTLCFSASGDFEGCPAGADQVTATSVGELDSYLAPRKRLLLHRGETFSGGPLRVNVQGPGVIGAYGSGHVPIVSTTAAAFYVSDSDPDFSDWRIMDLEVDGQGGADSRAVEVQGLATYLTLLRVVAHDVGGGFHAGDSIINYWNNNGSPGHDVIDGFTIADCTLYDLAGGGGHNFSYIAAHRLLLLGNSYTNSTGGEHVVRTPWIDRGVIAHNVLGQAPQPRHVLKMHAPGFTTANTVGEGKYTERVLISDNRFDCSGGTQWCVALGPQNDTSDERLRDVIAERNYFGPGEGTSVALLVWAADVSVRDNVFHRGTFPTCVEVGTRGVEPSPTRVTLVHNTCFSEVASGHRLVSVGSVTGDITAFNNLVVGGTSPVVASGAELMRLTDEANNLLLGSADFADPALDSFQDFALPAGSPAIDAADAAHQTFWDIAGTPRPLGTAPDCGAFEYGL